MFYFAVLVFKAETFSLELHLTKHVKRYNIKLKLLGYYIYLLLFGFSNDKVDLKNNFSKNGGDGVLLKLLIL